MALCDLCKSSQLNNSRREEEPAGVLSAAGQVSQVKAGGKGSLRTLFSALVITLICPNSSHVGTGDKASSSLSPTSA